MSLRETKEILNIDQQNILVCVVITDFDTFTTVRTPKGEIVRANKVTGESFAVNTNVEVRTDKKTYTVIGDSFFAEYAADRDFPL
jgi:hypothetical protein